jgi:hypothetical protein
MSPVHCLQKGSHDVRHVIPFGALTSQSDIKDLRDTGVVVLGRRAGSRKLRLPRLLVEGLMGSQWLTPKGDRPANGLPSGPSANPKWWARKKQLEK